MSTRGVSSLLFAAVLSLVAACDDSPPPRPNVRVFAIIREVKKISNASTRPLTAGQMSTACGRLSNKAGTALWWGTAPRSIVNAALGVAQACRRQVQLAAQATFVANQPPRRAPHPEVTALMLQFFELY